MPERYTENIDDLETLYKNELSNFPVETDFDMWAQLEQKLPLDTIVPPAVPSFWKSFYTALKNKGLLLFSLSFILNIVLLLYINKNSSTKNIQEETIGNGEPAAGENTVKSTDTQETIENSGTPQGEPSNLSETGKPSGSKENIVPTTSQFTGKNTKKADSLVNAAAEHVVNSKKSTDENHIQVSETPAQQQIVADSAASENNESLHEKLSREKKGNRKLFVPKK